MEKLVCFDLDDTLIREINSVMMLCILHGKLEPLMKIEKLEKGGILHWIEADYRKAALLEGLSTDGLRKGFTETMKPLNDISQTVEHLRKKGIRSIVVTAGPRQVASVARDLWGFDASYGSDYEVVGGFFTGKILDHIGDEGKIACLADYCRLHGLSPNECVAVGDGSTDIPLFGYCGKSVAINASAAVVQKAAFSVSTNSLADVLQFI